MYRCQVHGAKTTQGARISQTKKTNIFEAISSIEDIPDNMHI